MESKLKSWEWIYGKTPRFTVSSNVATDRFTLSFTMSVYRGLIESSVLESPKAPQNVTLDLSGAPFTEAAVSHKLQDWCQAAGFSDWSLFVSAAILDTIKEIKC